MPAQPIPSLVERTKEKIVFASPAEKISQNPSSQHLMLKQNEYSEIDFQQYRLRRSSSKSPHHVTSAEWCTVLILFFVNLINYMDRLTIAGILTKIQEEYKIGDAEGGLLQTAFVLSYMIFAPLFGYLGDRYSRQAIMGFGVFLWSIFTLIGSFMPNYWTFIACRAMVGIGEASYSTIAPTLISDMFVKDVRSKMLALFYFAIPVGSGMGYIVGAETTKLAGGDWRWGLRVTPILGGVAVILILFFLLDPPRGASEGHGHLEATTYYDDLIGLCKNRSFVLSTLAFTCVTFCTGALSWWGPKYVENGILSLSLNEEKQMMSVGSVAFIFGFVTMLSGIVGVPLGSVLSTKLKKRFPRADPLICGSGIVISAAFILVGMLFCRVNVVLAMILLFFGEVALNLNWSIVADILLYVVVPTRRGTAEAVQILLSHAFGDAGSPYLIGIVSDALNARLTEDRTTLCDAAPNNTMPINANITTMAPSTLGAQNKTECDYTVVYYALQYSLFINVGVEILGGILFFLTAIYIIKDKMNCESFSTKNRKDKESSPGETKIMLGPYTPVSSIGGSEESITEDDDDVPPQLKPLTTQVENA